MKTTKNYFVSLVLLLLLAVGCSTPEKEVQKESLVKTEIVSKTINLDPALVLESIENLKQTDNQRSLPYVYTVREYIFLRPNGAYGAGHVGVGFHITVSQGHLIIQNIYFVGAVENGDGTGFVWPGQNNGGWVGSTEYRQNMLGHMVNLGYTEYKVRNISREVSYDRCNNAVVKMMQFASRGYSVATNNCMNACWDTLWELRTPNVAWITPGNFWNFPPRTWFFQTRHGWNRFVR